MSKITNVQTLAEYANKHGIDVRRARRFARDGKWPMSPSSVVARDMPFKFGTVWAIAVDAIVPTFPPASTRGARRADGRKRFVVFCNATEHDDIVDIVGEVNVVDPRVAARERRANRKLDVDAAALADIVGDYDDGDYDDVGGHHA